MLITAQPLAKSHFGVQIVDFDDKRINCFLLGISVSCHGAAYGTDCSRLKRQRRGAITGRTPSFYPMLDRFLSSGTLSLG